MERKGQVELIAIVGILVVVAVVVALVYQTGMLSPVSLGPDARVVKDSVESFIRAGAYDTIKNIGINGGYSDVQVNSVEFLGKDVPYWQYGGSITIPDLNANILEGIEKYISDNKAALQDSMSDKDVTLGNPQVSVNVLSSKVELTVYMPTQVGDTSIPQPYVISIPSKLGDIYEFAQGFVNTNNQQRYFEYFTLSSMAMSPFDNGVQRIPLVVFLTSCGDFVFKTWWDVQPDMMDTIEKTLANTFMPGKAPKNMMTKSTHPKYSIVPINGKTYSDIDVGFYLPDGFDVTRANFDMSPDTITAFAKPIPMAGVCYSEPIYVDYYLRYPVSYTHLTLPTN